MVSANPERGDEMAESSDEVVMVDEDGKVLEVSDDEDVLLTKKRRASSRSRSGVCSLERRVMTYDESVESVQRVLDSDGELDDDFRFEIPEDVENVEV